MARSIGRVLAEARSRKGLSLQALARAARVDPSLISRLETGKVLDLRVSVGARLCGVLGLRLDDLVEGRRRGELPDRGPTYAELDRVRRSLLGVVESLAEMARRK